MDIGSIFLILALLIPVIIFIIRPLIESRLAPAAQSGPDLSSLLAQREHVVATIQELDDDNNLGKIPVEDYPPQRLTLLQDGVEILRKIDNLQSTSDTLTAENRLEAAINASRQNPEALVSPARKNGIAVPPVPDDDLEQKIASRRRSMQGRVGAFCPKCGRAIQATDQFCPHCGAKLA